MSDQYKAVLEQNELIITVEGPRAFVESQMARCSETQAATRGFRVHSRHFSSIRGLAT